MRDYINPQYCDIYDEKGLCIYCKEGFSSVDGFCYTPKEIGDIANGMVVDGRRIFRSILPDVIEKVVKEE